MTDRPLVSVVIPTFNRADCIGYALGSVLAQTYKNIEVIVVDDGSTDNTDTVIQPFLKDPRVHYIRQPNRERCVARNCGILSSHGEMIAFLDSDDYWLPDKIKMQVECLQDNPEVGIVGCEFIPFTDSMDDAEQAPSDRPEMKGNLFCQMATGSAVFGSPTWLIRRECFCDVGLYRNEPWIIAYEDLDMKLRIAARFDAVSLPNVYCGYRRPPKERSDTPLRYMTMRLRILRRIYAEEQGNQRLQVCRGRIGRFFCRKCLGAALKSTRVERPLDRLRLVYLAARYLLFGWMGI